LVVTQTFDRNGAASIPVNVFESFTFAHESISDKKGSRNLVQGIRYSKTNFEMAPKMSHSKSASDALHDDDADRDHAYLRIMHLNNWYRLLFGTLSSAMMMTVDIQANVMLSAALLSDAELITALGHVRWVFFGAWACMLMVSLYYAYREAIVEWNLKTSPQKGDLISNCSRWSRLQTLIAMIAFEFFLVEKDVKDMPINLHPWKGVQDFAAFKSEGHRAFFIGYRSRTMHRIENIRSVWYCLPKQLFSKTLVLVFKAFLMQRLFFYQDQHKVSISLLAATASSLVSVAFDAYRLVCVYRLRSKFYCRLISRLRKNRAEDSQYRADVRMLALHFRSKWDRQRHKAVWFGREDLRNGEWLTFDPFAPDKKSKEHLEKCRACGRKPKSPAPSPTAKEVRQRRPSDGSVPAMLGCDSDVRAQSDASCPSEITTNGIQSLPQPPGALQDSATHDTSRSSSKASVIASRDSEVIDLCADTLDDMNVPGMLTTIEDKPADDRGRVPPAVHCRVEPASEQLSPALTRRQEDSRDLRTASGGKPETLPKLVLQEAPSPDEHPPESDLDVESADPTQPTHEKDDEWA
jgi:hypothetical protein